MIPKAIEAIVFSDIQALVVNAAHETTSMEFKLVLPSRTDSAKHEFVLDVAAMANAGGGDIIYGIREIDGLAVEVVGLPSFSFDAERLRLEQLVLFNTDPRIARLGFQCVDGDSDKRVIVLRVHRTWASPHMVTVTNKRDFYMRHSNGKQPMDSGEIRDAFLRGSTPVEKARTFRRERLQLIREDSGAVNLAQVVREAEGSSTVVPSTKIVIHVLPLMAFEDIEANLLGPPLDIAKQATLAELGYFVRYNDYGFIAAEATAKGDAYIRYTQIFRFGYAESVVCRVARDPSAGPQLAIFDIEHEIFTTTELVLASLRSLGLTPPYLIMPSMLGVKGFVSPNNFLNPKHPIERDDVIMPATVVSDEVTDLDAALCSSVDVLWNAVGHSQRMTPGQHDNLVPWRAHRPQG